MERSSHHYKLLEKLGEGAHGEVYRGLHTISGTSISQAVAIKILFSENSAKNWKAEFEALAQIHSPYCVRPLALEVLQGRPALILEFVEGITLAEWAQAGPHDKDLVCEIIAQIELGLVDLAEQKLFHGDLSPKNIMIDKNGRIRLLDFGQSFVANAPITLDFTAPERLMGEKPSLASDLYSLGTIADWLLNDLGDFACYKSPVSSERFLRRMPSSVDLRMKLAGTVKKHLREKKFGATTINLRWPHASQSRLRRAAGLVSKTSAMIFFTFSLTHAESSIRFRSMATLQLRTHSWHYFYLDNQPIGYSPVDVQIWPGSKHTLKWENSEKSGNLQVQLKANDIQTLTDSDFLH